MNVSNALPCYLHTSNGVYDTALVAQSGLPKEEVYNYLGQLESLI